MKASSQGIRRHKAKAPTKTEDEGLDSFCSTETEKRIGKSRRPSPKKLSEINEFSQTKISETERLSKTKDQRYQKLESEKEEILKQNLIQCRLNKFQYNNLVEKKKRSRQIAHQVHTMTQEYLLMQKQIEQKLKKVKEFRVRAEQIKEMRELRESRKQLKESHKQEMSERNKQQTEEGIFKRNLSTQNKLRLIGEQYENKHQKFIESKKFSEKVSDQLNNDIGSVTVRNKLRAKDSKILLQKGEITKKQWVGHKLTSLNSDIQERTEKEALNIDSMHNQMMRLVQSQNKLKKELASVNSEYSRTKRDLTKLIKPSKLNDVDFKEIRKPTLTYDFKKFDEKTHRCEFLFSEEERKRKEFQNNQAAVLKDIEHSCSMVTSQKQSMH